MKWWNSFSSLPSALNAPEDCLSGLRALICHEKALTVKVERLCRMHVVPTRL